MCTPTELMVLRYLTAFAYGGLFTISLAVVLGVIGLVMDLVWCARLRARLKGGR